MATATSLAAHKSLAPGILSTISDQLEYLIKEFGEEGCTYEQLIPFFPDNMREGTIIGRIKPMALSGRIFRNGEKRPGKSGRDQLVIRHMDYSATVPTVLASAKKKENPYVKGMKAAAKIISSAADFDEAKSLLGFELERIAI